MYRDGYVIFLLFQYKMLIFLLILLPWVWTSIGFDVATSVGKMGFSYKLFNVMQRLCVDLYGTFKHFMFLERMAILIGLWIKHLSYVNGCNYWLSDLDCGIYIIRQRFDIGPHGWSRCLLCLVNYDYVYLICF